MTSQDSSSGTISLMIFLVFTAIYFMVKYKFSKSSSMTHYTIIYYLGVIVSQYFINLSVITANCGSTNWYLAFMVTLIPWVIIFGLLNVMLIQFPGWKIPFSNTFGYVIANAAGAKHILVDYILNEDFIRELSESNPATSSSDTKGGTKTDFKLANEAIQHIYSDPSLLINEVTPETFDSFWLRMHPLFKSDADTHRDKFYKIIELKDIIAESIWYILTGTLISSISSNYIATADCGNSAQEMKARHDEYEQAVQTKTETDESTTKKVYSVTQ